MLPQSLLEVDPAAGRIRPRFLGPEDHGWLAALLEERQRFAGRARKEWEARLRAPLPAPAPAGKLRLALRVLVRFEQATRPPVLPSRIRSALFRTASGTHLPREELVGCTARALDLDPERLEALLFADLGGERIAAELEAGIDPAMLAAHGNLDLARGLLARAERVQVESEGAGQDLLRFVQRRGLIAVPLAPGLLEVSGPFHLFRHTALYARALADLLPRLIAAGESFCVDALCALQSGRASFRISRGDPPLPLIPIPRFSARSRQLIAALRKREVPCELDPPPLMVAGALVFPDLLLERGGRRFLVEIAGFWTPDHLVRHLSHLRASGAHQVLVCMDLARNCGPGDPPDHPALVPYRRRLKAEDLLAAVDRHL